jgi:hypothetical protein
MERPTAPGPEAFVDFATSTDRRTFDAQAVAISATREDEDEDEDARRQYFERPRSFAYVIVQEGGHPAMLELGNSNAMHNEETYDNIWLHYATWTQNTQKWTVEGGHEADFQQGRSIVGETREDVVRALQKALIAAGEGVWLVWPIQKHDVLMEFEALVDSAAPTQAASLPFE